MARGEKYTRLWLTAAGFLLSGVSTAQAASIGISFDGGRNTAQATSDALAPTSVAGVVPQANYNVYTAQNQAAASVLNNDQGTATLAMITYSSTAAPYAATSNTPAGGTTPSTFDEALNNGGIYSAPTVNITNVPYASYNVYAYTLNDHSTGTFSVTLTPTVGSAQTIFGVNPNASDSTHVDGNAATAYVYTPATGATSGAANSGDYVVFTGLTSTGFTLTTTNTAGNASLSGFQIVSAPEPGTLGFLAIGGLGLLLSRRRQIA